MVTSGGQIDIGKVCPRPCEYFGVVSFSMDLLGELHSAVQDLIELARRSSAYLKSDLRSRSDF